MKEKRVKVNKQDIALGKRVSEKDLVTIDGEEIRLQKDLVYIALNKPRGYVCTNEEKEKNVFSLVKTKERLFVVGRLDKKSRGLVILTNDGDFAYRLTHPSFSHEKEYTVELSRDIDERAKKKMKSGVDIKEKTKAKIKDIERIGFRKYKVILTEGKKRQIRRMFEVFNCTVLDLQRVRIGKYELGDLKEKRWKYIEK